MSQYRKTLPAVSAVRREWIIASLAIITLVGGAVLGFALTRKTVTLVDDGKQITIKTRAADVKTLLLDQNVALGPHDAVLPGQSEKLADGARVEIRRAHMIALVADDGKSAFYSVGETVGDVLKEKKVVLNAEDIVEPQPDEKITGDTEIKVVRVVKESEVIKVAIASDTRRIPNHEMSRGISRTVSRGQDGEELQTWRVTYHDRQEVNRSLTDRQITSQPVDGVVEVGTGQTVSRAGEVIRFREALDVVATAYTYTGYNTSSGTKPTYGTVAVDPSVIPMGTRLYIEGYGYATALDRGSSIRGNRIDVFLETSGEAYCWGVKRVRIYIVD